MDSDDWYRMAALVARVEGLEQRVMELEHPLQQVPGPPDPQIEVLQQMVDKMINLREGMNHDRALRAFGAEMGSVITLLDVVHDYATEEHVSRSDVMEAVEEYIGIVGADKWWQT